MAPDRSGLPLDVWRGLEIGELERLLSGPDLPPRSPALHDLWRSLLLSSGPLPGGADPARFASLRLDALYRSGLLDDMAKGMPADAASSPLAQVLLARKDIGLGAYEPACRGIKSLGVLSAGMRERLKGEAQLLTGYCAARAGDAAAAGLAANLAREEGAGDGVALRVLDNLSMGTKPRLDLPARVSLLDYRFLELTGALNRTGLLAKAEPALLVALAQAPSSDLHLRTAAAEGALRINALAPDAVAAIYRQQPESSKRATVGDVADPVVRRARLFTAIEAARAPELKAQLMRALLEDARRDNIYPQIARMLAPLVHQLWPTPGASALGELVIEVALAGGAYDLARQWGESAPDLQHWLALVALADAKAGRGSVSGLETVDELASRGRLSGQALHRLATVLDALDINVPMRIWEAASRVAQPESGRLPETGVLADLAQSEQRKEAGRTALLAMRALGSEAASRAHILALGDTVRALKQAGLERHARLVAVEALSPIWPRARGN
jgi:hypothetical protein